MADIKNITIDGTTYDLKDDKARNDITDLKEDVNELNDVVALEDIADIAFFAAGADHYISALDGTVSSETATNYYYTDYIDISAYDIISYKRTKDAASSPAVGMALYDASKTFVMGVPALGSQAVGGYLNDLASIAIPANVVYARFTYYKNTSTYGYFELKGASVLKDALDKANSAFTDCFDSTLHTPINILNLADIEEGYYYWTNGKNENASYCASGLIPVESGKTYYFTRGNKTTAQGREFFSARFLIAYAKDGVTVLDSAQNVSGQTGYTIPIGVSYIRISDGNNYLKPSVNPYTMVQTPSSLVDFADYFQPYTSHELKADANNDTHINELIDEKLNESRHIVNGMEFSFDINSDNHIFNNDNQLVQDMFGYSIIFNARVTTLTDLVIEHGYNSYMGGYVRITPTQFSYYIGTEAEPRLVEAHNLTFKDYITVRIDAKPNFKADFTIYTNGGVYTKTDQSWDVRKGALGARSNIGTNVLSSCTLSYISRGWAERIHLYGDSYFGVYADKWTQYLVNNGWMKNNLNAYPGRASAEALKVLKNVISNSNPEKIVWCLGMNDGDDGGAVDTVWKACVDELMTICEARSIELILATIPNVATVDNTAKNAYVMASGYRYIDFASAVGASSGTTWYDNMLSQDGVHPSAQGAIALFNQAIADVPELMQ